MPRPRLLIPILLWLTVLPFCSRPDDQVIREQLAQMEREAEAGDWPKVFSHISRHYKDNSGNNYLIISQLIKNYAAGAGRLEVDMKVESVKISDKQAQSQIQLVVKGRREGRLAYVLGTDEVPEYPTVWWVKEGRDDWKIIRVEGVKGNEDSPW